MDKINIEKKLLLEQMDPITLEDIPESDDLDLEGSSVSAANLVKTAYGNLQSGRAIVRCKGGVFMWIWIIGAFAWSSVGIWLMVRFGIIYYNPDGSSLGFYIAGGISIIFIGAAIWAWKRCIKLFDVYFFRHKGKNILFYQNSKYTVYYRNRTEVIYIRNKNRVGKKDSADDFMNLKFFFNHMIGVMKVKEKKNGYKIKTKPTNSEQATLWIDKDMHPKKILIGDAFIYEFIGDLPDKIKIPKELLQICDEQHITRPPDDDRIEYV
jgi:hypothetical protein